MNKHIVLWTIIVLSFIIAGCTNQNYPNDDTYHPEWDYPYMFHVQGNGLEMTSTENGYYFLLGQLIYYMDKNGTKPVLLDNRPDHRCSKMPNITNCYALVEKSELKSPNFIQNYQSHLYILENVWDKESTQSRFDTVWKLSRLDLDGKNRKLLKKFNTSPSTIAIHRGYLYYATVSASNNTPQKVEVLRTKMDGDMSSDEVVYTGDDNVTDISGILPYGNQLYWLEFTDKGYRTQRYDLNNNKVTTLWDRGDGSLSNLLNVSGNKLYFSYFYGDPADKRTHKKYSSDLQGNQIEEVQIEHPPALSHIYNDKNYTYIRVIDVYVQDLPKGYPHELSIYEDDAKVHNVDLSLIPKINETLVGDERYMFIKYMGQNWVEGFFILDKSQIKSGQAEFKLLIEKSVKPPEIIEKTP